MTPPDTTTPPPKPTLFISYASEDRAAARLLRDALESAGLDVWYDENELGGGDAWDRKIRQQIRDCDYFMPVISAATERRKEGYFRREWRLAAERTLDMADDVMFLLPVTIDGTAEGGARVPEKFLSVQWLRLPGGTPTPALETLARRLATGEHPALVPPVRPAARAAARPVAGPAPTAQAPVEPPLLAGNAEEAQPNGPPPMPAFPHLQERGPGPLLKFFAEILWWVITAAWLLLRRAPRWMRLLIVLWFCFSVISRCTHVTDRPAPDTDRPERPAKVTAGQVGDGLTRAAQQLKDSGAPDALAQFGSEIARRLAAEIKNAEASDKQIVALPFATDVADPAAAKFLTDVFTPLWGRLAIERAGETALLATPLPNPSDEALRALGRKLDAGYVLGARLVAPAAPAAPTDGAPPPPAAGPTQFTVTLIQSDTGAVAWTGTFPLGGDAAGLGTRIADAVLQAAPGK